MQMYVNIKQIYNCTWGKCLQTSMGQEIMHGLSTHMLAIDLVRKTRVNRAQVLPVHPRLQWQTIKSFLILIIIHSLQRANSRKFTFYWFPLLCCCCFYSLCLPYFCCTKTVDTLNNEIAWGMGWGYDGIIDQWQKAQII